ncbi:sporulation peptidase YabG [Peribacillus sp. SCS-37]|uniref:sporulation peptidase YabG n=1 Tax=Paraperibacillus esterisolvens TaxID=3115296 RepID=UPI0039062F84
MNIEINQIVGRKSFNCDIMFRVIDFKEDSSGLLQAVLYGEDFRLIADAPMSDLVLMGQREQDLQRQKNEALLEKSYQLFSQDYELLRMKREYTATNEYRHTGGYFQMPGRVLHLDGDPAYLKKCLELYEKLRIPVFGLYCNEKEMPNKIVPLLELYRPDILVITGHDSYSKSKGKFQDINAYRHSRHFGETVREARKKIPHLDQLVIFAGACQSHFESLIGAGANFASSPSRVNIHALDPVYIVAKISFTPFMDRINVWEVLRNTLTGEKGLGGIETKGVLRTGLPYKPVQEE